MKCPACTGPLLLLGTLGLLRWLRCRNCGMQFSRPVRKKK